jgi:6-phosphogluconolactonase (cycloisomerase 2 family)
MFGWHHKPTRPTPVRHARLSLEAFEDRLVPAPLAGGPPGPAQTTVYIETNNPQSGQNAVIAYHQQANGPLREIGTFNTGGTGFENVRQVIGPDDSDQNVVASADGRFLFAVNQGSDTVSSFRILRDGGLELIGQFASGGDQPVSLGLAGGHLYVVNRGDSEQGQPGTTAPSLVGFNVGPDGKLSPIPGATATYAVNTSPAQALISPDGRFLFVDVFAVPGSSATGGNTIVPYRINSDGSLTAAPGGAVGAPVSPNLLLGSAHHPDLNIIYAGLTGAGEVGVFTYDETGRLNFVNHVDDQGAAPCWCAVSADGHTLYVSNTATDSIGVFSLADPLHPVQVQELALRGPLAPPGDTSGRAQTGPFQIALSPDGGSLYVVGQSGSPTHSFQQGNQLHVLKVARDGTVSEPAGPILFSPGQVPPDARIQGVVAVPGQAERRQEPHEERQRQSDSLFGSDSAADGASLLNALLQLEKRRD